MSSKPQATICEEVILRVLLKKIKRDFKLLSYDIKIASVAGVMGQYMVVNTKSEVHGTIREDSFFIKTFPENELLAKYAKLARTFEKEKFVYELLKSTPAAPECYYCSNNIMVMENLEVEGYTTLDRIVDSLEVVKLIIKSLAEFHAASIDPHDNRSAFFKDFQNNYPDFLYNKASEFSQRAIQACINGLSAAVDRFGMSSRVTDVIVRHFPKIFDLAQPSKQYWNVIVHGDLWPANLLVKFINGAPQHCKIIDFQMIRLSPPAQDLMSVLFLVTSREFREKYEKYLIDLYYLSLAEYLTIKGVCLENILPAKEFYESCETEKGFAVLQAASYFMLTMLRKESKTKLMADPIISEKAFNQDRSLMFLFAEGDEVYFKRIKESILDIVYYFGKNENY